MTQNERTKALQSLRDGRSRICVATDVAARGIDLPNLGLVVHADLPNDPEVLQHRSGRTGRAGKKGVSILLVPPARRRRAETLLQMADIDAIWGVAPSVDEIRALDQQRMMQSTLFDDQASDDDMVLARALLAERSAEEVATALARIYRSQLPAPEDILDPGESRRSRDDRGLKEERGSRREKRDTGAEGRPIKGKPRGLPEGAVWFRAAIGKKKNAEARWLLPMICRRGNISKQDIGTIRILDTTTEFEVSVRAAEQFALQIKRPDKEDNIRIEALSGGPQRESAPAERDSRKAAHRDSNDAPRRKDKRSFEEKPRFEEKPWSKEPRQFKAEPPQKKKSKPNKAADNQAWPTVDKPAFGKKPKKKKHRH